MRKTLSGFLAILFATSFVALAGVRSEAAGDAVAFSETVVESDDTGVTASPADKWVVIPTKGMSGGAVLTARTPGAVLEHTFNGAAISADMIVGVVGGMASVSLDGGTPATVDLYRNELAQSSRRIVLANNLTPGEHRLRIETLTEKNPKAVGQIVSVDTLRVSNTPYGSISGVVECKHNTGMPVMRADVAAIGANGEVDTATDASGRFKADALAPGAYSLRISHFGFAPVEQANVIVAAGQALELPKVILEENIGSRPLTFIRNPLGTRPVIVRPGDEFTIEVAAAASDSGWQAMIESPKASTPLEIKSSTFDNASGRWTLKAAAPAGTASMLFDLRLKFSAGEDFQKRAVMVVPEFKDRFRMIHLTDVHLYRNTGDFGRYQQMADEINLINPDLIVATGDLTDKNGYTDERWPESDQYPVMLSFWQSFNVPTFIVAGNHDLSPNAKEDDLLRWNRFQDVTDYSFDYGQYHFTAFNNTFMMATGVDNRKLYREDLYPQQLEWLEKDLAAHSDAKMRILLYHVPLHNTKSLVNDLAAKYTAQLALYGHMHFNQVDKFKATTYVQTASAYDGAYRVLNLEDGKIGEINSKKDGFSSFTLGTLTTEEQVSLDGRIVAVKVTNRSIRSFPGAVWRADMPASANYACDGCTVTDTYPLSGKIRVTFTFTIAPKGDTTATLRAE